MGVMSTSDDPGARLRAEMVAHLAEHVRLSDSRITAAVAQVPRHIFVPGVELAQAYADQAIVTRYRDGMPASSASQPAIVVIMLDQLRPPPGGSILEIGAGTGYNAALLSKLVGPSGRVITVDIDPEVAGEARAHLSEAGVTNVEVICGDGAEGWPDGGPYDGIIVTAGASDLAPAWVEQLAGQGRLVLPLSIRGVQQCVAFARSGGHLHSVALCDCGFMPLTGAMANADRRFPVPGHEGVFVQAAADADVDSAVVAQVLDDRGPAAGLGVNVSAREAFGSLRRWLALSDPASATLTYVGSAEGADASGVPPVLDLAYPAGVQRFSPCILGRAGFAALDVAGPAAPAGDSGPRAKIDLAVRSYGDAGQEAARLAELVGDWNAAGRPGSDRIRIDAYPAGISVPGYPPMPGTASGVFSALHATFVVSLS